MSTPTKCLASRHLCATATAGVVLHCRKPDMQVHWPCKGWSGRHHEDTDSRLLSPAVGHTRGHVYSCAMLVVVLSDLVGLGWIPTDKARLQLCHMWCDWYGGRLSTHLLLPRCVLKWFRCEQRMDTSGGINSCVCLEQFEQAECMLGAAMAERAASGPIVRTASCHGAVQVGH